MITFPYLCKKEQTMATTVTRVQTAFRLTPELLTLIRRAAKKEKMSVNRLVERTLEREFKPDFPKIPSDFTIDDDILSLAVVQEFRPFTKEELDADPKLAYLVEKNNL